MEIKGKKIMVLGGFGEVGFAICQQLLIHQPETIIVTSLRREEALIAVEKLRQEDSGTCILIPVYGNLFVRSTLKDIPGKEILSTPKYQQWLAEDAMEELTEEILTSSTLYQVISEYCPEIIVDCINTATALAYQNVYQSYKEISKALQAPQNVEGLTHGIYRLLSTLCIPPLIRHVQILYESMRRKGTQLYLKIGTTGSGGMGFNIPFTHGEEQPSRLLLSKSAVAGAQSLLLFLLSRTPGAPIIKEIKPAALIGWKNIGKGQIFKGGTSQPLYDCHPEEAYPLNSGRSFSLNETKVGSYIEGKEMVGVYIDTGENGLFSLDEFKVITALGLMQYVTPEEIAQIALLEIQGVNTSKEILGAISGATIGPTYRAGFLRQMAIREAEDLGQEGIAYGFLGPRISKLLFEVHLIKRCYGTLENASDALPVEISQALEKEIRRDQEIRSSALSIGIPVLLPDGKSLLFASRSNTDKIWEEGSWIINQENIEKWASQEWIDLRPQNMKRWQIHFQMILREIGKSLRSTSSHFDRGDRFWTLNKEGKTIIDPGEVVAWVLLKEGGGKGHHI